MDISYPVSDPNKACGCCVVYDIPTKSIVYSDLIEESIQVPYVPGFLAYKEIAIYRILLNKLKKTDFWPDVFLVDGQGQLHPRHFGSACVVGLEFDCPTIGVAKNPFCGEAFIDESKESVVHKQYDQNDQNDQNERVLHIDVTKPIEEWKRVIAQCTISENNVDLYIC